MNTKSIALTLLKDLFQTNGSPVEIASTRFSCLLADTSAMSLICISDHPNETKNIDGVTTSICAIASPLSPAARIGTNRTPNKTVRATGMSTTVINATDGVYDG